MTHDEIVLFDKLAEDRKDSAKTFEKPSVRKIMDSVIDKYSDQAHFIYELIQNADDAGASEARFILSKEQLIFIHNGKRYFSMTDVDNEEIDTEKGTLGDLNAITSLANSNKTEASIGKFGVGFKAVFQYTATPQIYDPSIAFRLDKYIVPVLLHDTCSMRKEYETAFVLPFNQKKHPASEAYADIFQKLQSLVFPTFFLKNLKKIAYQCGSISGEYEKLLNEETYINNTHCEMLMFRNGKAASNQQMWLFSRETEEGYKYSCGFFLDEHYRLVPTNYSAFCFFPTKKNTKLKFIINAPFLLTDSREGIKAKDEHNIRMISLLSKLAADSFVYLRDFGIKKNAFTIDDEIIDFLPTKRSDFILENELDEISFLPFYEEIKNVFSRERILPSFLDYSTGEKAYMANAPVISNLFENKQLGLLTGKSDAKWVFTTKGWEAIYRTRDGRADYLRDIISNSYIIDTKIIDMITAEFIESQDYQWLFKLYRFICDTDLRVKAAQTAPIFLTKDGKAVAAFNRAGKSTLFIDDEDSRGYDVISPELLKNESTKILVERLGIKTPELKDKIYTKILKKEAFNPKADFRAFLNYYIELIENDKETDDYIREIKDKAFILAVSEDGLTTEPKTADKVYFPTEELQYYFEGSGTQFFVCLNEYQDYLKKKESKYLDEFLESLGVHRYAKTIKRECDYSEVAPIFGESWPDYTRYHRWIDYAIDNDEQVINRIIDNEDKHLSELLWRQLTHIFEINNTYWSIPVIGGRYEYFFRSDYSQAFDGFCARRLRNSAWLVGRNGEYRKPSEITIQEISNGYEISSNGAKKLITFLEIQDTHPEYEKLDDSVRQKLETYDAFASMGLFDLPSEKVKQLLMMLESSDSVQQNPGGSDSVITKQQEDEEKDTPEEKVIKDLSERVQKKKEKKENQTQARSSENQEDSDEITRATVDYTKKIELAKQKCEDEISKLAQIEEAHNKANNAKKYSYGWFSALLSLEAMANSDDNANSREVSICFSAAELDTEATRTIILKHPDKNIPQVMEQLVDIPLDLTFCDGQTKRLIIEVANVQSYTLKVKVKHDDFLIHADFTCLTQAKIVSQNPSFLTRELQKEFARLAEDPLSITDDYDMQGNLCSNIHFIFGPPGTGKTTYLSNEMLIPLVNEEDEVRMLVLTPTNKAADVLVSRIIQTMGDDHSYEEWLIRYGATTDEEIEMSPVFHGKELEINDYKKCVIVTTMARLPYDYFIDSNGQFNYLHGINWDYMIVDEASMIPLVQMVYMLYLKTPKQFIIAGDPFQIEPTTTVSDWKGENIYEMVNLKEFSVDADTKPHKYEITLLTTQYRSIESIGEVFSQLTYGGVLKHARKNEDARPLNIERYLEYENLNIIRFPVSQFESIYRAKRLKLSSYQVYSALFVYEFASYIAKALERANGSEKFRIGIIAPYGAQAGLIDKLIASADIPDSIELTSGTIHGFQGDECDIVIALFNPPPKITMNKEMFLNRQNIINVAISRAKDYLFVLVPDDDTENVQNLWLINKLKKLIDIDLHTDQKSKELEKLLFDNPSYLEESAFSTGHQMVNVYGLPERRYEVRSEDNAIDVQVHGSFYYCPFTQADEEDRPLNINDIQLMVVKQKVKHTIYGEGIVTKCDGRLLEVNFSGKARMFPFPMIFKGKIKAVEAELQQKIEKVIDDMFMY